MIITIGTGISDSATLRQKVSNLVKVYEADQKTRASFAASFSRPTALFNPPKHQGGLTEWKRD